jgi:uncharacterized protein
MTKKSSSRNAGWIGVISDTHGLIRPEAIAAIRNCSLIIHAGDIGGQHVLDCFESIAPVIAVRGNNDIGEWADSLPETKAVKIGPATIYVIHNVKEMDLDPASSGFAAVISGHSHQPAVQTRDGVVFLNPGSAGPRRFRLPVSVARLRVKQGKVEARLIEIAV